MENKIKKLKEKLDKAKVSYEEKIPDDPEYATKLIFEIPAGREKHECFIIYMDEYLDEALNCNFEKFRFIKGHEAVWSNELGIIEAEVGNVAEPGRFLFNRLHELINKPEKNDGEENEEEITKIDLPKVKDFEISLGYCTQEFAFLTGTRVRGPRGRHSRRVTLKIQNIKATTHDLNKELLEKIANSIFFQIDLAFEIPIYLQAQREGWIEKRIKRIRKQMFVDKTATLFEPKYEYDTEPISLYWYAKESMNMPIFQYLAFYQTIEFYFPIYSNYEAKQKIQSIIKDPRFNSNRDADITKIISTIKVSSGGKSFGNERDQISSTLKACTDNTELLNFFKADENRFDFYAENKGKNIATQKVSVKNEAADFVAEVAERIYEIRCRIVHSKASEGNFDVLLPYSTEVNNLNFDIELIEFISRKVLITSSRPLNV